MVRRLIYIALFFLARLGLLTGRGSAQEFDPAALPVPTLGGKQFWADELFFHQWRIQRHAASGEYRLLDEHNLRYASGTYHECRTALEKIKQQRHLPRMSGKAVVVLHGLIRSRSSMESLCQYLRDKGGYEVFNVEYPSTQADIAEFAKSLRRIVDHLDGIEEINFIGHSMGNIIIRHYLGDLAREDPWKQTAGEAAADRRAAAKFGRFVMLAPPNQGSHLAATLADNLLFKHLIGDSGQQLGRDWPELEKRLATPSFEFGVIAGGKGNDKGYNPMLAGDNDGTISVATTQLAGARDFAVFPVLHSFIMDNAEVQQCTLRFLQHGYFFSAQKRRPIDATKTAKLQ